MTLLQQDKADLIRPKRKYEKKPKVLASSAAATPQQTSPAALPVFNAKDLNQYDFPSSDEEPLSQVKIQIAPWVGGEMEEVTCFDSLHLF